MRVIKLDGKNFKEETTNTQLPILIDFYATWCGPCKMLSPIVDEIAFEYSNKCKVCSVDVDGCPDIAANFNIQYMPTLVVLLDGKVKETSVGYKTKADIIKLLGIDK